MPSRPSMRGLTAFEAVMRHGTLAGAAEELNLTPSAISHRIKALEGFLGVELFHRVHRSVTPTDMAQDYYQQVSGAFGRIEQATRQLKSEARPYHLFVHSAPTFATQWLMPRLSGFLLQHPDIDVRVTATPQPADPEVDEVDIDIRYGFWKRAGMEAVPLCEELVTVLASPEAVARDGLEAPESLAEQTLIHSTKCLVQWQDWLDQEAPQLEITLDRGPRFDRSFLSLGIATQGLGVCLESTLLAYPELKRGTLVAPFGKRGKWIRGHFFTVPRQKIQKEKVRLFKNWMAKELESARDWIRPTL